MTTINDFTHMNQTVGDFPLNRIPAPEAKMNPAKLELITNIMNIRKDAGIVPDGEYFDTLDDKTIDELHNEVIKAQDLAYALKNG